MDAQYITIKTVKLNNNCPECYSKDGLELTFKQKFKDTSLYRSVTSETKEFLKCNVCNSDIYPVMWTDDIERVISYQRKAFTPKTGSLKLKKLAWILLLSIDAIIILIVLIATGVITL